MSLMSPLQMCWYTWRRLASYAFITIKLLRPTCDIMWFICAKIIEFYRLKVVSCNLAHPVHLALAMDSWVSPNAHRMHFSINSVELTALDALLNYIKIILPPCLFRFIYCIVHWISNVGYRVFIILYIGCSNRSSVIATIVLSLAAMTCTCTFVTIYSIKINQSINQSIIHSFIHSFNQIFGRQKLILVCVFFVRTP